MGYIVGLIEGDGCFSNGGKNRTRFSCRIALHERDRDLLYKLKEFLGLGQIYERKGLGFSDSIMVTLDISRKREVKKLIELIDASEGFHGDKGKKYLKWKEGFINHCKNNPRWNKRPNWQELLSERNILEFLEKKGEVLICQK